MLRLIGVMLAIPWRIVRFFLWVENTLFLDYVWSWFLGMKPIPTKEGWSVIGEGAFDCLDYKKRADGTLVRLAPWEWTLLTLGTVVFVATLVEGINTANLIASAIPFGLVVLSWFIETISRNWDQVQPRLTVKVKN